MEVRILTPKETLPERVVGDGANFALGEEYLLQVRQAQREEDVRPEMEVAFRSPIYPLSVPSSASEFPTGNRKECSSGQH